MASLIASMLLSGLLAGCTFMPSAQRPPAGDPSPSGPVRSVDESVEAIQAIDGVTARIARANDGSRAYLSVNVELDEAFAAEIAAGDGETRDAALLDFVLGQVWSQGEESPERYVTLGVTGAGRDQAAITAALAQIGVSAMPYSGQSVSLKLADLESRYGSWPGAVPELPATFGGTG
ncbi:hypothetical protein SAMN06295909_2783 [Plantibacter sp. VKM Ac-1784]|uniref:Lipoprotein n=1 Tax=Plantibacter elymi (nom. nud.) TaxID=199708 RepID=A0ABY1RER4_9MICO|nr:hypothetical protein [Plantibacter sp. VKM Ac-1784]SMQ72504.1 hypothetical protein SAMN06295909_2783 [Plantibacter sp. VKM Ac-1784]